MEILDFIATNSLIQGWVESELIIRNVKNEIKLRKLMGREQLLIYKRNKEQELIAEIEASDNIGVSNFIHHLQNTDDILNPIDDYLIIRNAIKEHLKSPNRLLFRDIEDIDYITFKTEHDRYEKVTREKVPASTIINDSYYKKHYGYDFDVIINTIKYIRVFDFLRKMKPAKPTDVITITREIQNGLLKDVGHMFSPLLRFKKFISGKGVNEKINFLGTPPMLASIFVQLFKNKDITGITKKAFVEKCSDYITVNGSELNKETIAKYIIKGKNMGKKVKSLCPIVLKFIKNGW